MPNAYEAVRELSTKYDIFVATAAMEFPNHFVKNTIGCIRILILFLGQILFFAVIKAS